MSLSGKIAVITGGATGIGFGTAKVLAQHGACVIIAQRDARRGNEAVERLRPADVLSMELDIRDASAVEQCMKTIVDRFGRIDVLVNNASVTGRPALASFLDSTPQLIDQVVDTNLKGTVYCSQAVARHMVKGRCGGSVVHVSSVGAYAAQENASLYCATKAAQVMLTKAMAIELAAQGIRVNCVVPGDIQTENSVNAVEEIKESGASGKFLRFTPLGGRGCSEDIARAIAFLASDDARFVTGTTLVVDGGFLCY